MNQYFNMIVQKVLRMKKKIVTWKQLKNIVQNVLNEGYNDSKAYKYTYYLKNRWYILSIKKDIFLLKKPDDNIDMEDAIDMFYWQILKLYLSNRFGTGYFVWWVKSLELLQNNFQIPDKIMIINSFKNTKEALLKWKIIDNKVYTSHNITEKAKLFKKLKKFSQETYVSGIKFQVASLEHALLETLYSPQDYEKNYIYEIVRKALKKNMKNIDMKTFWEILKLWKHHTSINRLYNIANSINPTLWTKVKAVIKKYSFDLNV